MTQIISEPAESTELISLEKFTSKEIYDPNTGLMETLLQKLDTVSAGIIKTMEGDTKDGRTLCMRNKNKVVALQKIFDTAKKFETKELKEQTNAIDRLGKLANDKCEELKTAMMKPRKEFEEKLAARQAEHMSRLNMITEKRNHTGQILGRHLIELNARIAFISGMTIGPAWEEFETRARSEWKLTKDYLDNEIITVTQAISDKARLDELEAAEAKRKAETAQAPSQTTEAPTAATQGPPNNSGIATTQEFGAGNQNATVEHRRDINRAILSDLIGLGLNAATSKQLIQLIAANKINHLKIEY